MGYNKMVKIIENEISLSKVLVISFPKSVDMKLLFTPKLENLSLVKFENNVSVNLINPQFQEFYETWIVAVENKFKDFTSEDNLVEKFNTEIKGLIYIGKKSAEISLNAARGLYGELLELKKMIILDLDKASEKIRSWHRPAPANHDFDLVDKTVEIKTISRTSSTVKISTEFQLEALEGIQLYLKVYRIDHVEKSNIDSLGDLYNVILQLLAPQDAIEFQMKCADDEFNKYLGPDYNKLNYKFNVLEEFEFLVDQDHFPRLKRNELNPAISKVTYQIDLSSMLEFNINNLN
jgi:hypothetical protein